MARDDLFVELRSATEEARTKETSVRLQGIRFRNSPAQGV